MIAQAEELFNLLNTARTQGLTYRTADFLRLVELYASDNDGVDDKEVGAKTKELLAG